MPRATFFSLICQQILGVSTLVSGHLALMLRTAITERLHSLYFSNKRFYSVNELMELDNADQRLTQDIGTACTLVSDILPLFLINPILVIFYSYKCVERAGWLGPVASYIMFVVYAIITHFVTIWTSRAIYEQDRQEGNFRFFHTQVRTASEGVAFLDLGEVQRFFASTSLWRMLHAYRVSVNRKPVLFCLTQLSAYTGSVLSYLAIGTALFGGMFGSPSASEVAGIISENSFYLLYLINKLTTLVELANKIAQLVGVGHRVVALEKSLTDCETCTSPAAYVARQQYIYDWIEVTTAAPGRTGSHVDLNTSDIVIQLNKINVALPLDQSRVLIQDLSLTVRLNRPLLITGPSGVGKTTLFRVLAELWPATGQVEAGKMHSFFCRSPRIRILLVPQRPFVPSAFACPYELFTILGDGYDHELVEYTLSHGSNITFRGLHLAYLLLTVAYSPQDPNTEPKIVELESQEEHDGNLSGKLIKARDGESAVVDRVFCGFPVTAYLEALNLLLEFRLIDPITANYIGDRLRMLQFVDHHPPNSNACSTKTWTAFRDVFRLGCRTVVNEYDFAGGEWPNVYSPGEMQRLILAAVCLRQPHMVFLDESTSQLNEYAEHQAYESLKAREITPISVGHRMSLRVHHVEELRFSLPSSPIDLSDLPPHRVEATGPNWYHIVYNSPTEKL
ncbi:ATP-binding cassette sub-family D member 4 [Fasciola gigantica]|uniref:ATP-binding cassette sub-family D member 4 n=1 Tax=Fasciola gigantica TaxID=46835 RepID=A0A504YAS3_FASGI|nr:ATP-binding cassette sub-family D member 4 [Fasciola gigantica]